MIKAVVIGRNYTSRLGMIRAVGKVGYSVIVVNTTRGKSKDIDAYSRYVSKYCYAREPDRNELIKVILSLVSNNSEKIVLIPVDDYAASTIDNNIELLKKHFLFPHIGMQQGAINHIMNKDIQKELARNAGLKVTEGWIIDIKNHKYTIPSDIQYPCFPKPQISFLGNKCCMKKCSTETELRIIVEEVASIADCPLLVEQYIEIEKEYGVLGFCIDGKSVTPGIVEKLMIGEGAHKGVTKLGIVTPLKTNKKLFDSINRFLQSIRLTGLCDIDLYESNGVIYFNELNLRFGAFGYSLFCSGANLPKLLIKYLSGESINLANVDICAKTICLSEKVNFEDYIAGYYGKKEYDRISNLADFTFLADKDDMKPYKVFCRRSSIIVMKSQLKKYIKKILHS